MKFPRHKACDLYVFDSLKHSALFQFFCSFQKAKPHLSIFVFPQHTQNMTSVRLY